MTEIANGDLLALVQQCKILQSELDSIKSQLEMYKSGQSAKLQYLYILALTETGRYKVGTTDDLFARLRSIKKRLKFKSVVMVYSCQNVRSKNIESELTNYLCNGLGVCVHKGGGIGPTTELVRLLEWCDTHPDLCRVLPGLLDRVHQRYGMVAQLDDKFWNDVVLI